MRLVVQSPIDGESNAVLQIATIQIMSDGGENDNSATTSRCSYSGMKNCVKLALIKYFLCVFEAPIQIGIKHT